MPSLCARKLRSILVALVAVGARASGAHAQATASAASPVGVWRGTSLCLVRPSPCKDEVVVYRIASLKAGDSLSLDARKVVNGREEAMGVLVCRLAAHSASITCAMPNGVWRFTMRGDSLVGDLRLLDNTKFRDVRTVRGARAQGAASWPIAGARLVRVDDASVPPPSDIVSGACAPRLRDPRTGREYLVRHSTVKHQMAQSQAGETTTTTTMLLRAVGDYSRLELKGDTLSTRVVTVDCMTSRVVARRSGT